MNTTAYSRIGKRKIFFLLFIVGVAFGAAAIVMYLWNFIFPDVLSAKPITYWQAFGLLILSRILFGGFRFGRSGHSGHPAAHWRQKWSDMSEEEKEKMKAVWKEKCRNKNHESH